MFAFYPGVFRDQVGGPSKATKVGKALRDSGELIPGDGRNLPARIGAAIRGRFESERMPIPNERFYMVTMDIADEDGNATPKPPQPGAPIGPIDEDAIDENSNVEVLDKRRKV